MSKPPILAGTLYKRGKIVQSWKHRYFVLDDECLTYFTRKGGAKKGVFNITRATECEDASFRPFCFYIKNEDRTLFLAADDMTQKDMWMEAMFSAIHIRRVGFVPGQSFDSRQSSSDRHSNSPPPNNVAKRYSVRRVEGMMKSARAKYQERPQLVVKVIQARNLLGKDMNGTSDPYVVCTVGSSTVRTTTRDKDLNPQWGMVFMFDFDRSMRYMKLEVWDEDQHTRDDFLGVALVPLFNLPPNQKITRWYPLGKRSTKSHVEGDIEVEISCNKSLPYSPLRLFREVQALPEFKMLLHSISQLYEGAHKALAIEIEGGAKGHVTHTFHQGDTIHEVALPKFPAAFPPVETEMLEDVAVNVTLKSHTDRGGVLSHGLLLLTNYRLMFVSDSRMQQGEDEDQLPTRAMDDLTTQIPVGMIASVALSTETNAFGIGVALGALRVQCRDSRVLSFLFRDGGAADSIRSANEAAATSTPPEGRGISRTFSRTKSLTMTPPWKLVSLNLFGRRDSNAPPMIKTNIFSAPGAESAWTGEELEELEAPYADEGSPYQRFYSRLNLRAINRHNEVDEAVALHTSLLQILWDGRHIPVAGVPIDGPEETTVVAVGGVVCETIPEESEGADVGSPPTENSDAPIHNESAAEDAATASQDGSSSVTAETSPTPAEESAARPQATEDENPTAPIVDAVFGSFVSDLVEPDNLDKVRRALENGWHIYDPVQEFRRIGVPDDKWRVSEVNAEYELCSTYPSLLAVPRACSDELLLKVAAFRSKGRLPVLSWRHPVTKATICRCSQPLVGLNNSRSEDDETLVSLIRTSSGEARLPRATRGDDEPSSPTSEIDPDEVIMRRRYVIVDARPKINAQANQAAGKGFESVKCYDNCSLIFMNIGNIHVMRKSLELLEESCTATSIEDANWFHSLEVSGWLGHVHRVLSAAVRMVHLVSQQGLSVLVHCSDGWDRTAQLAGLAMLFMDPFYRTLRGFLVLIEKEWISFGHKFADRLGHGKDGFGSQDRSPIFHQFLDCVFQCMNQAPSVFEFNEDLLLFICEHMHTGWFGTFLFNCERERAESGASKTTMSMWTYVLANEALFKNATYAPTNTPVVPVISMKRIVLWHRWFLRWHDRVWQQAWKQNNEAFMEEEGPTFWLPDTSADRCYDCERPFTFYRRRHHCRSCGFIFCEPCACHLRAIPGIHEDVAVRVCLACSKKLDLATKLNQKHVMQYLASSNTTIRGVVLPHTTSFRTASDAPPMMQSPVSPGNRSPGNSLKRSMSFPPRDMGDKDAADAAQPRITFGRALTDDSDDADDDLEDGHQEESKVAAEDA